MEKPDLGRKNLKKFGVTMAIAFILIAAVVFLKHHQIPVLLLVISGAFFLSGTVIPEMLGPVYIFWMRLAFVLSWINTRIILLVLFYLILTPIGIMMRLSGKDILEQKIDKDRGSYWKKREKKQFSPSDCLRQF